MKRITVTVTDDEYDELWAFHVRTRKPLAQILVQRAFGASESLTTKLGDQTPEAREKYLNS